MNLVWHHFRKEHRYLRPRWLAFLALLGFELAVNLEWLLPMRAGVPAPDWLAYLPVAVLLSGLSLLLSCPEDRPGTDRSFIGTRPLPARTYWTARLLIWLLLIVLPVVLQNGLYLAISGRPSADVLRGMWERFCFAAGFTAWLLPALVLWKRGEIWQALFALALIVVVMSKVLDVASGAWWNFSPSFNQTWPGLAAGWAVFAVLSGLVAWLHLTRGFTFRRRLVLTMLAANAGLITARFWAWADSPPVARDPALVQKLAPGLEYDVNLSRARFDELPASYGPRLTSEIAAETHEAGVHVVFRPRRSELSQAGNSRTDENTERRSPFETPQEEVSRGDHNLRDFFPKGTLLVSGDEYYPKWTLNEQPNTRLAVFSTPPPKFDEPLTIASDFEVDWYQRDVALELPVTAGARGECADVRWEILRVAAAEGPQPGALTVSLRMESRSHWDAQNGHAILLHLPRQRLVRLKPAKTAVVSERGEHTGWRHRQIDLAWEHLFNHSDGEPTGVEVSQAHLVLLRSQFLGQSEAHWKSPEFRLKDFPSNYGNDLSWREEKALYAGRVVKAFEERVAAMTPPTSESSENEARRYVYDLFTAASVTNAVYTPAAHPSIAQAFEPLGRHHLPLMLNLRAQNWPGWTNKPPSNQLERYVTEDQREALIDRALDQVMLADLVLKKGWSDAAKRLKPRIFSSPALLPGAQLLLIAWKDDEDAAARLLAEARNDFHGNIVRALDQLPETKPAVEALIRSQFDDLVVVVPSHNKASSLSRAAEFGSVEAFDLCLRWLAIAGDLPPGNAYYPFPALLNTDGSDFWKKRMPAHELWPLFRRLKVSDFEYVPEKRAWKFRQP